MDTTELRAAYDAFLAEASAGGFTEPSAGEWGAEDVYAHVAANDHRLAAVTEAILAGEPVSYDNDGLHDLPGVTAARVALGSDLLTEVRRAADRLCAAAEQLDDTQALTLVQSRIVHDGDQIMDEEVPWGQLLLVNARRHLPMHTEQLRGLRTG